MVQVKIFEFVGVANLATRQRMELSETLNGVSFWLLPLGFPPGEAKNSETMRYYHPTERSVTGASGRQIGDPYKLRSF